LEVLVLFEVNMLVKLDPTANFIGSDKDGASLGLQEVLYDTIYDIDDIKILDMEIKEKE
tara:strand:- start:85 stop:261 length:177 start_codon:yes stop_codon:yes gene_type:complete